MGSLPDIFKGIGNWFTGGGGAHTPAASPTTPPAGAAGGQAAAPASYPNYMSANIPPLQKDSFLDNPLLQGALAAYFGAISSPRSKGFGGALGAGGLAGLKQYESAQKAQLEPYLMGAQIQKLGAEMEKDRAGAKLDIQKVEGLKGIASQNHQTALAMRDQAKKLRATQPEMADLMESNAAAVDYQTNKAWDPGLMLLRPYDAQKDLAQFKKDSAEADEATVRAQKVLPAEASMDTARAGQAGAEADLAHTRATQEVPMQAFKDEAEGYAARARTATSDAERAEYMSKLQETGAKIYDAQHPIASKIHPDVAARQQFISDFTNNALQMAGTTQPPAAPTASPAPSTRTRAAATTKKTAATAAGGIPPLPKNAKEYAQGPNGEPGWHDMNGGFHAF